MFAYITNRGSNTLSRLTFPPCTDASVPSSTLYDPPPFSYDLPGTYNVRLLVNEGLPDQVSLCKTIVISAAPTVSLGSDRTLCPGDSTLLDAGPGFSSYAWSTGAATRTIWVKSAGSYWVSVTHSGCPASDTVNVATYLVNPVDLGPDQNICTGQTATFDAGACPGCTYQWSDLTHGLPNIGSGQTYTTGTAALYKVVVTDAHGCRAADSSGLSVTTGPPVTNSPPSKTICSGETANIVLQSGAPGAIFSWTASLLSGNVTGFSNGSGPVITDLLGNGSTSAGVVQYTITATLGGCAGPPLDFVVTVDPLPDLTFIPPSASLCSGGTTNILLVSQIAGATFSWTATGSSGTVSGYSDGNGFLIAQTLTNTSVTDQTVTYHVTPAANGCTGTPLDYAVTVKPGPDVSFSPPSLTICSGSATNILLQSQVPGATFTWTASGSSGFVSGYSAGSGMVIVQTLVNTGVTDETVTYHVSPSAGGCTGIAQDYNVTVSPLPGVIFSPPATAFCSGGTTGITLQSLIPGAIFTWTATGSSGSVSGFADGSGSSIIQTLVNTGFVTQTVTYHVTATAGGCTGNPVDYPVTVLPVPDVYFLPSSQSICTGQITGITILSQVTGATFTWTATCISPGISGYGPGSGNMIQQTLINTGFADGTVSYHATAAAGGCTGNPQTVDVIVKPAPQVSLNFCTDTITYPNARPFLLKGGIPPGGTYSGPGVNSATSMFYPGLAGTGNKSVTYTCTGAPGCSASDQAVIHVLATPPFACGNNVTDPRDNQIYPTVMIGTQCWMAANLNYGTQIAGTQHQRDNCIREKYCYNDSPAKCLQRGAGYQWDELMQYDNASPVQGLCLPGWHIPDEAEWNTLFANWINNGFAGSPLKYSGYSGFNAWLNGALFFNLSWSYSGFATYFWTSSAHGADKAWAHPMNNYDPSVAVYPAYRDNAFSVRCLKD
ncbi:MAG TPA: PKD-like domain-containing protein [Bacteroidales bacterium]|nr:PKD-like domain-containing protein [Bacteroidales bacterium]